MAGQSDWKNAGSSTNAYVVNPLLEKEIYYESTYKTVFGRLNGGREVTTTKAPFSSKVTEIDAGNDSILWEKNFTTGNEVRFTLREENKGMATYGAADVKPGSFAQYMHSTAFVNQVDSPSYPIVDSESEEKIKEIISDLISVEKANISVWRGKEVDLDGFRSIFEGASRGLLLTTDGGMGVTLPGGSAGAHRSSYHNILANSATFVSPNYTLATHEASLSTALAALTDNANYQYDYAEHEKCSYWIDRKNLKTVKIGGMEYRAVAFIDPCNMHRLTTATGTLDNKFLYGRERAMKNPALYHMDSIVLDDILYLALRQVEFFRPTADGSTVSYGAGLTQDPRDTNFSNSSKICPTVFMGAGALLRGRRKKVFFTVDYGTHGKGATYCVHYHDGWMRHDWVTKDGRSTIMNDSMFIHWSYDPGVGKAYAA